MLFVPEKAQILPLGQLFPQKYYYIKSLSNKLPWIESAEEVKIPFYTNNSSKIVNDVLNNSLPRIKLVIRFHFTQITVVK